MNLASDSTAAGATTFAVQNVGAIPHELVVIRTDLAADALPVSGDTVDLGQLDVVADSPEFAAGQGGTVDADLTAGSYVLICNVPGHYGLGMRTALTATASTGDGAARPAPAAAGNAGLIEGGSSQVATFGFGLLALALVGTAGVLLRRQMDRS